MAGNQLSQVAIEVIVLSDTPVDLKLSQVALEVIVDPGSPIIRISQDVIELLSQSPVNLRVSQDIIETLSSNSISSNLRVSQDVIEILSANPVIVSSSEQIQFYIVIP
jgi:hypothetical protein